jgi:hypothetical protein
MNVEETKTWVQYHTAAFPRFTRQYANMSDQIKRFAFERALAYLSPFDLDEAKRATDVMAMWEKPVDPSQHIAEIIRIMQNRRPREVELDENDRPVYRCRLCHDSGVAPFYCGSVPGYDKHIGKMYDNETWRWHLVSTNCFCKAAEKNRNHQLEKNVNHMVSGWLHKSEMTEFQIELIEHGHHIAPQKQWQTPSTPEDF